MACDFRDGPRYKNVKREKKKYGRFILGLRGDGTGKLFFEGFGERGNSRKKDLGGRGSDSRGVALASAEFDRARAQDLRGVGTMDRPDSAS